MRLRSILSLFLWRFEELKDATDLTIVSTGATLHRPIRWLKSSFESKINKMVEFEPLRKFKFAFATEAFKKDSRFPDYYRLDKIITAEIKRVT